MDSRAAGELRRIANQAGGPNAAVSADIVQSQRAGGGSVSFVEVQAGVQDVVAPKPRLTDAARTVAPARGCRASARGMACGDAGGAA